MASPSRNGLVGSTPKPNRKGLAAHIGNDPKDPDKIPISPGDVITSVHQTLPSRIQRILQIVVREVGFKFQASKDAAEQIVVDVLAARHFPADGLGFAQQGFGFRDFHFHSSTVGRFGSLRNAGIQGVSR